MRKFLSILITIMLLQNVCVFGLDINSECWTKNVYLHGEINNKSNVSKPLLLTDTHSKSQAYKGDNIDIFVSVDDPNEGYPDMPYVNTYIAKIFFDPEHLWFSDDLSTKLGLPLIPPTDLTCFSMPQKKAVIDTAYPYDFYGQVKPECMEYTYGFYYDEELDLMSAYVTYINMGGRFPNKTAEYQNNWYDILRLQLKAIKETASTSVYVERYDAPYKGIEAHSFELIPQDREDNPDKKFNLNTVNDLIYNIEIKSPERLKMPICNVQSGTYTYGEGSEWESYTSNGKTLYRMPIEFVAETDSTINWSYDKINYQVYEMNNKPLVSQNATIYAYASKNGRIDSPVAKLTYKILPPFPKIYLESTGEILPKYYDSDSMFNIKFSNGEQEGSAVFYTFASDLQPDSEDLKHILSSDINANPNENWVVGKFAGIDKSVSIKESCNIKIITLYGDEISEPISYVLNVKPKNIRLSDESPKSGYYNDSQTITLLSDTPNTDIYYTVDGTDPKKSIKGYENTCQIKIDKTAIVKAVSKIKGTNIWSNELSFSYIIQKKEKPIAGNVNVFPNSGYYDENVKITLFSEKPTANIYYTIDGSDPKLADNTKRILYSGSNFEMNYPDTYTKLRAAAEKDGYYGEEITAEYYLRPMSPMPDVLGGSYSNSPINVTFRPKANETIYYTLDNSVLDNNITEGTAEVNVYENGEKIKITQNTTLRAVSKWSGNIDSYSSVSKHKYVFEKIPQPKIELESGTYYKGYGDENKHKPVISFENSAYKIMYTLDGSLPSVNENEITKQYKGEIELKDGRTVVNAIALDSEGNKSNVSTSYYTVVPKAPQPNVYGGVYSKEFELNLRAYKDLYDVCKIYYTTDGSSAVGADGKIKTSANLYSEYNKPHIAGNVTVVHAVAVIADTIGVEVCLTYYIDTDNRDMPVPYPDKIEPEYDGSIEIQLILPPSAQTEADCDIYYILLPVNETSNCPDFDINKVGETNYPWKKYKHNVAKIKKSTLQNDLFENEVTITESSILKALSYNKTIKEVSNIAQYVYQINIEKPEMWAVKKSGSKWIKDYKANSGKYDSEFYYKPYSSNILDNENLEIYWTDDGSIPKAETPMYSVPNYKTSENWEMFAGYPVKENTVINAIVYNEKTKEKSDVATYVYQVKPVEMQNKVTASHTTGYKYEWEEIKNGIYLFFDNSESKIKYTAKYTDLNGNEITKPLNTFSVQKPIKPLDNILRMQIDAYAVNNEDDVIKDSQAQFVYYVLPEPPYANTLSGNVYAGQELIFTALNSTHSQILYTKDKEAYPIELYTEPLKIEETSYYGAITRYQIDGINLDSKVAEYYYAVPTSGGGGGDLSSSNMPLDKIEGYKIHVKYMNGYSDGTIRPEQFITREETAAMMYNIVDKAKISQAEYSGKFDDVEKHRWSMQAIEYLSQNDIINGYDNLFKPDKFTTRGEYSKMIVKFFDYEISSKQSDYSDIKGHWANDYINTLSEKDYVSGYSDTTFKPDSCITRAEAVKILNKALKRYPDATYLKSQNLKLYSDLHTDKWYYADVAEAATTHIYVQNEESKEIQWDIVD